MRKFGKPQRPKEKKVKISKAFQDQSDQEVEKGKEAYIEFLRGAGWIESKDTFKLIEQATSILATLSEKQELQTFKKTIPAYIEKLIKSLEKDEFDMNDLEGGVHPLRRHLRWIAIMLQSLNMFVPMENGKAKDIQGKPFIPKPKKDFGKTVKNDPAVVKYSIINNSGVLERAIYIDKGVYEYLTYFIGIFGRCKDSGQRVERFAHIFLETGEAKNQEEAMAMAEELASNHPDQIDFRKVAPKVEQELKDSGLLEELQDEVVNGIAARLAEIRGG